MIAHSLVYRAEETKNRMNSRSSFWRKSSWNSYGTKLSRNQFMRKVVIKQQAHEGRRLSPHGGEERCAVHLSAPECPAGAFGSFGQCQPARRRCIRDPG